MFCVYYSFSAGNYMNYDETFISKIIMGVYLKKKFSVKVKH